MADDGIDPVDGSMPGDWRLPNVRELQSLIDYGRNYPALPAGHPFDYVQNSTYWTSTTYASFVSYSYVVSLATGNTTVFSKENLSSPKEVWCVRDGQ